MAESRLSADRLNEERAFIRRYTEGLTSHKVEYPADFSTPLEHRPRKVTVVQVPIADAPEVMDVDPAPVSHDTIQITVKSLKPPLSFAITASTTDPISHLKKLVAKSAATAPPADSQRLLLKGKALVDSKLVKEYPIVDGSVLTLMLKPPTSAPSTSTPAPVSCPPIATGSPGGLPALTITTETDNIPNEAVPVTEADIDTAPTGPQPQVSSAEFHRTISDPKYWQRLHALCVSEFTFEDDADAAWETFLISMKGRLSAGEAAKIRDVVGVRGMGGGA
ncbi:hypothetical protein DB88DRAFT_469017 [Papiliotrema laurentii]|uniref:Ubiquitin-like domain-containing protein n=1 Tax=Papiliotrema laurentii TaxID=5418 RepID=A0AAD9CRH3_PAPLA|nr:hypothetical protein DB88DRAFT_469017 [Papiliotrema laurentii]